MSAEAYFALARERHAIWLRRSEGLPPPWTVDPILQEFRFCNVFRELDKTTIWFRSFVRDPYAHKEEALLATVLFRWFNRITSGQALFCQIDVEASSAFELYLRDGRTEGLKAALITMNGVRGPHVTGSYIVLGKRGMPKMDGVVAAFHDFAQEWNWREMAQRCLACREQADGGVSLAYVWDWLRRVPYLGDFMAYEIVSDLRWTRLLNRAPDILTWANPGPGARRGAARVLGTSEQRFRSPGTSEKPYITAAGRDETLELMRELLRLSRDPCYWPQDYPAWEMREAEHWLCEYDKYSRVGLGQGRPRQKMRYPV